MVIKSKLTKQDFIKLNFILLYGKLSMKLYTVFIALGILTAIGVAMFYQFNSFIYVIGPFVMLIALPLLTYFGAVRNYTANNRITETIEYHFDNEYLSLKGESFNSQLSWGKIYKVTHIKNWILIWQNKQVSNPIPKGNISEEQIGELKAILNNNKVKNNL